MRSISILFFIIISVIVKSQNIDSLLSVVNNSKNDTSKIRNLHKLADAYKYINSDSSLYYYNYSLNLIEKSFLSNQNPDKDKLYLLKAITYRYLGNSYFGMGNYNEALQLYNKSVKTYINVEDKSTVTPCVINMGVIYSILSKYSHAQLFYNKALVLCKITGNTKDLSQCYVNLGVLYDEQGNYDKALDYYLQSLAINEKLNDKQKISLDLSNVALVFKSQKSYAKSLDYSKRALQLFEELGNKKGMSNSLNNIGNVLLLMNDTSNIFNYYKKALEINKEMGDKYGMSATLTNMGNYYLVMGKYDKVLNYYNKALDIKKEIADNYGITLLYVNISDLYISLTDSAALTLNQEETYLNLAIENAKIAMKQAKEMKIIPWINSAARTLMVSYKKQGNIAKSLEYSEIYIKSQDEMFSNEKTQAMAEVEAQFENEKKQLLIDKMESEKERDQQIINAQKAENKRQLLLLISAIVGFIMIAVFLFFVSRMLKQKRKAHALLAIQHAEILQQKEEIESQRDEISGQRDVLLEQKAQIEIQQKEITDSITYARSIQRALLPIPKQPQFPFENFLLFKPKDIISGDFYWTTRIQSLQIIAVADCTGHGVPGSLMSMLGISFLNEIVRKKEVVSTHQILELLRTAVIDALQQSGTIGEQQDGMDICVCVIDTDTLQMQYSGANNPLYFLPKSDGILQILKPDKMPIGIHARMDSFTSQNVQLRSGDILYLCSDGYADQLGGVNYKKFSLKKYKELISEIYSYPLETQKQKLDFAFNQWMGKFKQTDDITILGIKV